MAKCQKSENFLSELQQAFLQAKRSVQEQMVSQVNCRDHEQPCLSEPGSSVCLSKALCAQPGLSISTCKGPGPVSSGGSAGAGSVCVILCCCLCPCTITAQFFPPYSLSNSMSLLSQLHPKSEDRRFSQDSFLGFITSTIISEYFLRF